MPAPAKLNTCAMSTDMAAAVELPALKKPTATSPPCSNRAQIWHGVLVLRKPAWRALLREVTS